MSQEQKDYSSISPSAKSLLMMKGYTNIPYAKEIAALMQGGEVFELDFDNRDFWFWVRVMHFESRYWSIDQLLKQTNNQNILELSSGYSLRGLDFCARNENIHYIDTDLPEVIASKKALIAQLRLDHEAKGKLELLPLNAMDKAAFDTVVARLEAGPLTIINEGLLMYLNTGEKERLCQTIRQVLQQRGGCWITADIYVKRTDEMRATLPQSKGETEFFRQHQIEENKFDDYESAKLFFNRQGFELVAEAMPDYESLSVMPNLLKVLPEEVRNSKEPPPKVQATWMLRTKDI